jgi:hypothetical protein
MLELLKELGVAGLALGAVAWLAREIVTESLRREADQLAEKMRRDTELTLEKVRHDAGMELERHKHRLSLQAEEHRVRFSKLVERRIDLVAKLYSEIADFLLETSILKIRVDATEILSKDIANMVTEAYDNLQILLKTYKEAEIYIPKNVASDVWNLISPSDTAMRRAKAHLDWMNKNGSSTSGSTAGLKSALKTISLSSSVRSVIPHFHELLGVEQLQREARASSNDVQI